jgi:drug/metabolite transporter (DMT)-like permease
MIYLLLSIFFSTSLLVIFKFFEKHKVNNLYGIIFNYLTAATTGFLFAGSTPNAEALQSSWFPFALITGTIFISLFFVIAMSSQQNGLAITSVSNKMSLVIPVIAAAFLFGDELNALLIFGIVLAVAGVIFTALKKNSTQVTKSSFAWLFPVVIFLGSGTSDTLLKYTEQYHLQGVSQSLFSAYLFGTAAFIGLFIFLYQLFIRKNPLQIKDILGGICLGVPNYFSIHFLLLAFQESSWDSSVLIPVNNIGIVVTSAAVGLIFYRERYSLLNWIGLGMSIAAIALIAIS